MPNRNQSPSASQSALLKINQLAKSYTGELILKPVNLSVKSGEIICLLGPSGCGKTTLLRLIAGLETPDKGQIIFDNRNLANIPPHQRGFGLMFQEFALFPHKNVQQNIAFGLQMKQQSDIAAIVQRMLDLVGLTGFEKRDINSLSGGERQRVALARSLAPDPRLLMLDEPLGALDRALRERLMIEIRAILKRVGLTAIYVTHDQLEAFAVADRIVVLNQGQVEQIATPEQLYYQPATSFVAGFLGFSNLLAGTWLENGHLKTALGSWSLAGQSQPAGHEGTLLIRPDAARLEPYGDIRLEGEVVEILFRGKFYQVKVQVADQQLSFEMGQQFEIGELITLWLDPQAIQFFDKNVG